MLSSIKPKFDARLFFISVFVPVLTFFEQIGKNGGKHRHQQTIRGLFEENADLSHIHLAVSQAIPIPLWLFDVRLIYSQIIYFV